MEIWVQVVVRDPQILAHSGWHRHSTSRGNADFYKSMKPRKLTRLYFTDCEWCTSGDQSECDWCLESQNVLARNYLLATIKREQQSTLYGCTTAQEMWPDCALNTPRTLQRTNISSCSSFSNTSTSLATMSLATSRQLNWWPPVYETSKIRSQTHKSWQRFWLLYPRATDTFCLYGTMSHQTNETISVCSHRD